MRAACCHSTIGLTCVIPLAFQLCPPPEWLSVSGSSQIVPPVSVTNPVSCQVTSLCPLPFRHTHRWPHHLWHWHFGSRHWVPWPLCCLCGSCQHTQALTEGTTTGGGFFSLFLLPTFKGGVSLLQPPTAWGGVGACMNPLFQLYSQATFPRTPHKSMWGADRLGQS